MLVEKKEKKEKIEICPKCGSILENNDYIYRRRAPNVRTYVCMVHVILYKRVSSYPLNLITNTHMQ